MKNKPLIIPALPAALLCFISAPLSAAFSVGDSIVIDFGKNDTTSGNWNNVTSGSTGGTAFTSGQVLLANAIRFSDGAATGVNLTTTFTGTTTVGIGGLNMTSGQTEATAAFTVSGVIPFNAQRDLSYFSNAGVGNFEFGGLNNALTYRIEFQSLNSNARNALAFTINPGHASELSITVDPNKGDAFYSMVHLLNDIPTMGDGKIIIRSAGTGDQHINALELTAVPEPATYAAILGLLTLGVAVWRRRR